QLPAVQGARVEVREVAHRERPGAPGVALEAGHRDGGLEVVRAAALAVVDDALGVTVGQDHLEVAAVGVADVELDLDAADGDRVRHVDGADDPGRVVVGDGRVRGRRVLVLATGRG